MADMDPQTRAVDEQVDRFVCGGLLQSEVFELPKASGESRVVGHREPQPEEAGQRPEEPFGLAERKVEDHADGQGRLDDQVRIGGLTTRPPGGGSPPGFQGGVRKPDREGATSLEPGFLITPVPHPIRGLGILVLATFGIPHRRSLRVEVAVPSRCNSGRSHAPTPGFARSVEALTPADAGRARHDLRPLPASRRDPRSGDHIRACDARGRQALGAGAHPPFGNERHGRPGNAPAARRNPDGDGGHRLACDGSSARVPGPVRYSRARSTPA
jgi:hypothetical protein